MYRFTHTYSGAFSQANEYIGTISVVHNINPVGGTGISDAPSDTKTYGRKDAAWVEVTGGGGSGFTGIENNIATFDSDGNPHDSGINIFSLMD